LDQRGVDIEYIVVDAGSTDGSRDIIEKYRNRLARVILEKDEGPADGLNKGFSFGTGELFGCLNSDDFYLEDGVKNAVEAARRFGGAGAVVGNGLIVDAKENTLRRAFATRFSPFLYVHGASFALHQSSFYRRDAFQAAKGFNIENKTCWDGEMLLDIALQKFPIRRFDAYVGAFRLHDESITVSGRLQEPYLIDVERMFEKVMRRPRRKLDRLVVGPALRVATHFQNPRALAWKLVEKSSPVSHKIPDRLSTKVAEGDRRAQS
jgi:glycosyltransferase involved in cell wall biosynthesis